jgi:hypothetical protein
MGKRRCFVTEAPSVTRVLEGIGEPAQPPPLAPARGPPAWEAPFDPSPTFDPSQGQPQPAFDQTVAWCPPGWAARLLSRWHPAKTGYPRRLLGSHACSATTASLPFQPLPRALALTTPHGRAKIRYR